MLIYNRTYSVTQRDGAVIIFKKYKLFISVLIIVFVFIISGELNIHLKDNELTSDKVVVQNNNVAAVKSTVQSKSTSSKAAPSKNTSAVKSTAKAKTASVPPKVKTVVIDAGHGGYDVGSIAPKGITEKNITLSVATKLGNILESKGVRVIYTRKSDTVSWPRNVLADLQARIKISNSSNADLYISIHTNSSIFKSAKGVETYYAIGASSKSKTLAGLVQNQIVKDLGRYNRGIKSSLYYVLRNNKLPSVLVELGFISNSSEVAYLNSLDGQSKYANSIAKGILNYLNSK